MSSAAATQGIQVIVRSTIFQDPESGFTIANVYPADSNNPNRDYFTAKGVLGQLHEGEKLTIYGEFAWNAKYQKRQFEVSKFVLPDPRDEGIDVFLMGGFLKGVGTALGGEIYGVFGDKALDILETDPDQFLQVKGIGQTKLKDIVTSWVETRDQREALSFFSQWNIGPATIKKILKRWPNVRDAISKVRENPYVLAWEIKGVGFTLADKIARTMAIPRDAKMRVEAAIGYSLDEAAKKQGHCYLPRPELAVRVADFLSPETKVGHAPNLYAKIHESIDTLFFEQKVIIEGENIFLRSLHLAETKLAKNIQRLKRFKIAADTHKIDKIISEFERKNSITLHQKQREAVLAAASEKVAIITGGPGTGKTTIIKCLLYVCEKLRVGEIKLVAPTGKAAQRMMESCEREASTIHRLLGFGQGGVSADEQNPLKVSMLICDETSMVDVFVGKMLTSALPDPARFVLVGDVDQLPPVSAGNVLKDLIGCGKIPVVYLEKVYRQSENSFIPDNARAVLRGNARDLKLKRAGDKTQNDDSFLMSVPEREILGDGETIRERSPEERGGIARQHLIKSVLRLLQKGYSPNDIMVLSPKHGGDVGVGKLNEVLQKLLNPSGLGIGKSAFKVGDRVMQTKNNYEKKAFNGDQGYIVRFSEDGGAIEVDFGGRLVEYCLDEVDELTLAYAITVHKAQGMESPCVIQFVCLSHWIMLNRNILYTGITRAKKMCLLIGEQKAIGMAVRNNKISMRYTALGHRI